MIKGKFYTGLPSEMMARTRTVNRQQSHFFWPDETDLETVSPRTKRTVSKPAPQMTTNNNNAYASKSDFSTKDLVRKQLSSGIEFYDNVNAKTPEARRRRFKKIDNINLNNNNDVDFQPEKKKLETFSSKIEFYDFEPERKAKTANLDKKPVKQAGEMRRDEIKSKNDSPDVAKKRISFITEEKPIEKTKSILKNSEEKSQIDKVLVKPLPKRGLLPKNLSKSVENISRLAKNALAESEKIEKPEKLSTIIREVKNLNLSQERSRKYDDDYDRDERDSYSRRSDRIVTRRNDVDRDYELKYSDKYDNRGYHEEEDRYRREERGRGDSNRYNDRYDDYDDRRYEKSDRSDKVNRSDDRGYRYERTHKVSYSQPKDNNEYRERSRHFEEESPIRDRRSPNYNRHDYEREYSAPRRGPIKDSQPIGRKPIDYDEPSNRRTIRHEEEDYSSSISRPPKHIPQHLQSNILFNGRVMPQTQRPMSVRNSAVTRVGVGLPDYE